jgi:release factor glutamine methyltransferase
MTLKELRSKFLSELSVLYPTNEIHAFFGLLLSHRLGLTKIDIALKPTIEISKDDLAYFLNAFAELQQEKPIQYILGETEFFGIHLKVTKDTLIPRPETEELVDWILNEIKDKRQKTKNNKINILDIGTGSGCIAISLAKNIHNSKVSAIDISTEALVIAKQNAALNSIVINFIEGNILDDKAHSKPTQKSVKYDIIVSNPPYVREQEKQVMKNNVIENEPHLALFVKDNDPLIFYSKIADFALINLCENGSLYFEINQYLSIDIVNLLKNKGYKTIELKKDSFENYRMVKATF